MFFLEIEMRKLLLFLSLVLVQLPVHAALNVFACEPEWAALAMELGGDKISVYSATTGMQDPHHIQPRPSLIAKARSANLVLCTGAGLEEGWLPQLLRQAANPDIQPGKPGYFEAAAAVTKLEVPARLDRAEGDIHAAGNPHIQLDPRNIKLVADALLLRLVRLDPDNVAFYETRYKSFHERWSTAMARWEKQAAPLRGAAVVVHHKAFPYLSNWLGLKEVAVLESKPGIEPTATHLARILAQLQTQPARMVLRGSYDDARPAQWLGERAKTPVVALPLTVGGTEQAKDLFALFDDILARLLGAAK
jgi:zinc/manganese transport system substrate-binding protein